MFCGARRLRADAAPRRRGPEAQRASDHADAAASDEAIVRGEEGRWRYRDPRMRAEWRMRSPEPSSQECAHRNRPLRYDGRIVVTLCAEEILSSFRDDRDHQPPAAHARGTAAGASTPGR